jgi:hypothetical protein
MVKQAFWDGFEKQAISPKWIMERTLGGIASRAGGTAEGILKRKERLLKHQNASFSSLTGKERDNALSHWRSLPNKEEIQGMLSGIGGSSKGNRDVARHYVKKFQENMRSEKI